MSTPTSRRRSCRAIARDAGLTLVELMVALAVGALLVLGAVQLFMQGLRAFRLTESLARLEENARLALDAVERDVQMAGYFGVAARGADVEGRGAPDGAAREGPAACGNDWATRLDRPVEAHGGYRWACPPSFPAAAAADTLVVRRVDPEPVAAAPDRLHVQSALFGAARLFAGAPAAAADDRGAGPSRTYRLVVNGYYVSTRSTLDTPGNFVPSLRMKTLQAGPAIGDEEVLPGIEDLQVQLGVDTDATGAPGHGAVDRYVDPDDLLLDPASTTFVPHAQVRALRVWLRARAELPEPGFTDGARYAYADQDLPPFADGFRRVVVSRTIHLRNARAVR